MNRARVATVVLALAAGVLAGFASGARAQGTRDPGWKYGGRNCGCLGRSCREPWGLLNCERCCIGAAEGIFGCREFCLQARFPCCA